MNATAGAGAEKRRNSSDIGKSCRCGILSVTKVVALTAAVVILSGAEDLCGRVSIAAQRSTPGGLSPPSSRLEIDGAGSPVREHGTDGIDSNDIAARKPNYEERARAGSDHRERPEIATHHDRDPVSESYGQDFGTKMWRDDSVGKDGAVAHEGAADEASTRGQGTDGGHDCDTAHAGNKAPWTPIPFFGCVDGEAHSSSTWSHLNHRVEEYREDLVKVVQSLDMIINTLESSAAAKSSVGGQDRDTPGEGMRQLAVKLRRKLDKTPPRWQVNTDVLSWLLRPVPFVTGLPSPAPSGLLGTAGAPEDNDRTTINTTANNNNNNSNNINNNNNNNDNNNNDNNGNDNDNLVGHQRNEKSSDGVDVVVIPAADASGAAGEEEVLERRKQASPGESSPAAAAAIKEKRATPVPIFEGTGDGGDMGSGGTGRKGANKRSGFHAYDETHQVFTHILRDWTSEGDTVRAGVYDPLLKALDDYVGWQEDAAPSVRTTNSSHGETTGMESGGGGGGGGLDDSVGGSKSGTHEPGGLGARSHPERRFASLSSASSCARRRKANVLVPGAGLGRLAAEVAARGYASVHANELSTTMLSSCYWLMEALRGADFTGAPTPTPAPATPVDDTENEDGGGPPLSPAPAAHTMSERGDAGCTGSSTRTSGDSGNNGEAGRCGSGGGSEEVRGRQGGRGEGGAGGGDAAAGRGFFKFYPFLNDAAHNEIDGEARFRSVLFPDPEGRAVLERASGKLSFQAGEFSATYGGAGGPYEGVFDAVVTSFFVDTAPNVVQYVATIRRALRPGGVWINCGPLHWHDHSALALSLDEMLVLVAGSGFRMEEARQLPPSAYRVQDGAGSLRVEEFSPVFWVSVLEGDSPAS